MLQDEVSGVVPVTGRSNSRKEQRLEVLVFLSLIAPSMALSFFVIRQGGLSFTLTAVATILRDLSLVGLVAFFVWRTGEGVRRIGWAFEHSWREVWLGAALFVLVVFGASVLEQLLQEAGLSAPSMPLPQFLSASSVSQFLLAWLLVLVVAVAEETMFRGYLILRFRAVTGSSAAALLLSTVVFALGHGYEGSAGVVTVGALGLAYALVYEWRKSLVAPIVMHFLQDFVSVVVLPLLKYR
jgi:membrane protease YdiL (CAAX protease family)